MIRTLAANATIENLSEVPNLNLKLFNQLAEYGDKVYFVVSGVLFFYFTFVGIRQIGVSIDSWASAKAKVLQKKTK